MARATKRLSPKATMVQYGYGQVEGNKLSARYNGKIFAQLPADKDIEILENGMFVKYDEAKGVVNFDGPGEWLLVFNEVKVYQDRETDADFAMIKDNYNAIVYNAYADGRYVHYMPGTGSNENGERELLEISQRTKEDLENNRNGMMPEGTTMVPRVLKTDLGDTYTTNCIKMAEGESIGVGDTLTVDASDGYLKKNASPAAGEMVWQVTRVYNMPDLQPGVKLRRTV